MAEPPRRVKFASVSQGNARVPSWLPQSRPRRQFTPPPTTTISTSMKPPRLPAEFVDAVRQSLGEPPPPEHGRELRHGRPSEFPGASQVPRAQGAVPSAPAAVAAQAAPAPMPVAVPTVSPELELAFQEAVGLLAAERQRVFEQTAGQLAELAAVIARRVIAREVSLHPELVLDLVREGLEALGKHDRVTVRIGAAFESQREVLHQRLSDQGGRVEVRLDPSLGEHGCVIETELGQVDESLDSRLGTLLNALRPDSQDD